MTTKLGICVGGADWFVASATARETWLGRPFDIFAAFGGHGQGMADYVGSITNWMTFVPPSRLLAIAVPFFPLTDIPTKHMTAAGGDYYVSRWKQIAQILVNAGHHNSIIRPGWEFQGDWYPWGFNYPGQDKTKFVERYVSIFRQLVDAFRSIPGQNFQFDWCPNFQEFVGGAHMTLAQVEACYPGDAYVDIIGLDIYDKNPWGAPGVDHAARWALMLDAPVGLNWQKNFAIAHNKQISFPEWAAGAVGDNPLFIENMAAWIAANNVAYHCYWDRPVAEGYNGALSDFPQLNPPETGHALQRQKYFDLYKYVPPNPFVKGINLGAGPAVVIGGNQWIGHVAALADGLSITSTPTPNKIAHFSTSISAGAFLPNPVDADTAVMLNQQTNADATNMVIKQTLPNGTYNVTLHTREAAAGMPRRYGIKVQGVTVHGAAGQLAQCTYQKYGPYTAVVSNGELVVELVKDLGSPSICGLEIANA